MLLKLDIKSYEIDPPLILLRGWRILLDLLDDIIIPCSSSFIKLAGKHQKYKRLRNRVNSLIKKDVIQHNDSRMEKAKDENEVWKIVSLLTLVVTLQPHFRTVER